MNFIIAPLKCFSVSKPVAGTGCGRKPAVKCTAGQSWTGGDSQRNQESFQWGQAAALTSESTQYLTFSSTHSFKEKLK